jgi:hypothetical protein
MPKLFPILYADGKHTHLLVIPPIDDPSSQPYYLHIEGTSSKRDDAMNPIIKNEELNNRPEEESTQRIDSADQPATCSNGVCVITWKPQRPQAA